VSIRQFSPHIVTDGLHSGYWQDKPQVSVNVAEQMPQCSIRILSDSAAMIQTLRHEKKAVVFYYFRYTHRDQHSPAIVLGTLLRQLVAQQPTVDSALLELYRSKRLHQQAINTEELVDSIAANFSQFSSVNIVLDALDECAEDDWPQLRAYLNRLRAHCPAYRLFATSRPTPSSVFGDLGDCRKLGISATYEDIAALTEGYLEHRRDSADLIRTACVASNVNLARVITSLSGGMSVSYQMDTDILLMNAIAYWLLI
jgi:hypothetical protein